MDTFRAIPEKIKELRLARGFSSQRKLCDFIEDINNNKSESFPRPASGYTSVAESSLRNAENLKYERPLRADILSAIAYALEVPLSEIAHTGGALNPYRGLAPYGTKDRDFFFGRREEITFGTGILERWPILAIIGDSGVGKSSLALAGIVPRISRGEKARRSFCMEPGGNPIESLLYAMSDFIFDREGFESPSIVYSRLADALKTRESLHWWLMNAARRNNDVAPVLVVDQWEQLYSSCRSCHLPNGDGGESLIYSEQDVRSAFVSLLTYACEQDSLKLILTVRADFYGEIISGGEDFRNLFEAGKLLLGPMSEEGLREVIEAPDGVEFSPGLVDRLVRDASNEPGHLPLLSFVLEQLWDRRDNSTGQMTATSYDADIGGLQGAIGRHAEACVAKLSIAQQKHIRVLLPMLVDLDRVGDGERELRGRRPVANYSDDEMGIVRFLAGPECRILRIGSARDGEAFVEIAHEALLREWPTLENWLADDKSFRRAITRLRLDFEHHKQKKQSASSLLPRGDRLNEAEAWLRDRGPAAVGADLAKYINDSSAYWKREGRREGRRLFFMRTLAGALVASVLGAGLIYYLAGQRAETLARENLAVKRQAATAQVAVEMLNNRNTEALALALTVWPSLNSTTPPNASDDPWAQLMSNTLADQQEVLRISSPNDRMIMASDGIWIYAADQNGTIEELDVKTGETNRSFTDAVDGQIISLEVSGDGSTLGALTSEGAIKLLATDDFSEIYNHDDPDILVEGFSLSHTANRLATIFIQKSGNDWTDLNSPRNVDVYDLQESRFIFHANNRTHIFLSDSGNYAALRARCFLTVYSVQPISKKRTHEICQGDQNPIAMSNDLQICLFSTGQDSAEVRPCALKKRQSSFWADILSGIGGSGILQPGLGAVERGLFSKSGDRLAIGFADGWVVYDAMSGAELFRPPNDGNGSGETYPPSDLKFFGDDHVGVAYEGFVSIFRISPNKSVLGRHPGSVSDLTFSADGRHVFSSDENGLSILWDVSGETNPVFFPRSINGISAVALSRDNTMAVAGTDLAHLDKAAIRVFDVASQEILYSWEHLEGGVLSVAISEDKRLIAAELATGAVKIFEIDREEPLQTIQIENLWRVQGYADDYGTIKFTEDGTGLILFGDPDDLKNAKPSEIPAGPVGRIEFSSEATQWSAQLSGGNRMIMSWGPGAEPVIFDQSTEIVLADFGEHNDHVRVLRVSNDETLAVAGTDDGNVVLYRIDLPAGGVVDVACAALPFPPDQIETYLRADLIGFFESPVCFGDEIARGTPSNRSVVQQEEPAAR